MVFASSRGESGESHGEANMSCTYDVWKREREILNALSGLGPDGGLMEKRERDLVAKPGCGHMRPPMYVAPLRGEVQSNTGC